MDHHHHIYYIELPAKDLEEEGAFILKNPAKMNSRSGQREFYEK